MEIDITPTEKEQKKLTPEHVQQAHEAIDEIGYVILNNAISHENLDKLYEKMYADTQELLAQDNPKFTAGSVPGHLQQAPPPMSPWVFPDIVANPFAIQVVLSVLGEAYLRVYSSNTNCPGSGTQPLHRDTVDDYLWPGHKLAHPAYSLIVNLAPVDVTIENGAIELWPRTHNYLKGSKHPEEDVMVG